MVLFSLGDTFGFVDYGKGKTGDSYETDLTQASLLDISENQKEKYYESCSHG